MPDNNDDRLSFLNSPWVQLGVPIAAMAATAIAPRHAGPAARIGMYGFNSMNDMHTQQMRLSQLKAKEDAELQEQQQEVANYGHLLDGLSSTEAESSGAHAPEGGTGPEADMSVKDGLLAGGVVPTPHTKWDPRTLQMLRQLPPKLGYPIISEFIKQQREDDTGYDQGDLPAIQKNLPGGIRLSDVDVRGVGRASIERPQPRMVSAHEGGRETNVAIDPYSNERISTLDVGEHRDPSDEHVNIVEDGDKTVAVYHTSAGVQKKVVLGPAKGGDPEKFKAGFWDMVALRAMGKSGFNPLFEAQVSPDEAKELAKTRQSAMEQIFGGFGGFSSGITPGGGGSQP